MLLLVACAQPSDSSAPKQGDTDCVAQAWYWDLDGDSFGGAFATEACTAPAGAVATDGDCDDDRATVHPGAPEVCDLRDDDCDGDIDEDLPLYAVTPDDDGDGYGDPAGVIERCDVPDGWVEDATDCDDTDSAIHPGADELCDGQDNDCDGLIDDDDSLVVDPPAWYADADGDGFGDPSIVIRRCDAPPGKVDNGDDCDDHNASALPGGTELCLDRVDQDCDGSLDDYTGDCAPTLPDPGGEAGCGDGIEPVDVAACEAGVATVRADGSAYATVQDGLDAARAGEVLTVCPGVWTEGLTVKRAITLVGYGAGVSVLSGDGLGADVLQVGTPAIGLIGLTLHGYDGGLGTLVGTDVCLADSSFGYNLSSYCGGVVCVGNGGALEVDRSVFFANLAASRGGALATGLYLHEFLVRDSLFQDNQSNDEGGAVALYGGGGESTVENTWFLENTAAGEGGALTFAGAASTGPLVLVDVLFDANVAGSGGALGETSSGGAATFSLDGVTFSNNASASDGGAMRLDAKSIVAIVDSVFVANVAGGSGGAVSFGGWTTGGPLSFEAVSFEANSAYGSGGAINLGSHDDDLTECTACVFTGNAALGDGGAVSLGSWGNITFTAVNSAFIGNTAADGGALNLGSSGNDTVTAEASVFDSNSATIAGGAVKMSIHGTDSVLFTDCTVTANLAPSSGGVDPSDEGTITSIDTDWGTGGTDNAPTDIGSYQYGAGASFVCVGSECE